MPPKRPLFLAALAAGVLVACTGGDDDAGPTSTTAPRTGCPVASATVAEALARPVAIDPDVTGVRTCAFVGSDDDGAGARVEVVARSLEEQGFGTALEEVERRAGPTVLLPDGLVDGAERGWIATVGRAVQLGAADDETLVVVAVTDPLLDAEAAQAVAARLAGEALKT